MSRRIVHVTLSTIVSLSAGTADGSTPVPANECAALLTFEVRPDRPLPPALQTLARDLDLHALNHDRDPAANMRQAIESLSASMSLSPEQTKRMFNDRALGRYQPIVLKYVTAELTARGFDPDGVIDFLLNFDLTFPVPEQIEFADAVARRMVVTLNDRPSTDSDRGLRHFLDLARDFGVTAEVYAEFQTLWRLVRRAEAPLVHFIAENIRRAANQFSARVREATAAEEAPAAKRSSGWSKFLGLMQGAEAPRPPDPRVVAAAQFDLNDAPAFIREVDALDPARPAPPVRLARWAGFAAFSRVPAVLDRLELSPADARTFLVRSEVPYLSADDLERLAGSREFARAGEPAKAIVNEERAAFARMTEVARAYARARHAADHRAVAARRAGEADHRVVWLFRQEFIAHVGRKAIVTSLDIEDGLRAAHDRVRREHEIGGATFLEIAREMFDYIVPQKNGFRAVAMLEGLCALSRTYVFDKLKLERFLKSLANSKFQRDIFTEGEMKLATFVGAALWLDPSRWGQDRPKPAPDHGEDLAREIRARLAEFRALLPEFESAGTSDAQLEHAMLESANRAERASFTRVEWR